MQRRKFLQLLLSFAGFTALFSFLYPAARFLAPPRMKAEIRKLTLLKNEVLIGEAKEFVFNDVPAIIIHTPDKGYIALSRVCTHLGCLVLFEKDKNILLCPCHRGIYDLEGNVVSGPPPKPLPRFPLTVKNDTIVIG
jgi:cytochrome b6-f complex iron-sulfur subunit